MKKSELVIGNLYLDVDHPNELFSYQGEATGCFIGEAEFEGVDPVTKVSIGGGFICTNEELEEDVSEYKGEENASNNL